MLFERFRFVKQARRDSVHAKKLEKCLLDTEAFRIDNFNMSSNHSNKSSDLINPDIAHKIENAKNQLERMIDLTPQIMLLVDSEGAIVRANKPTLEFLKTKDFTDVLGKHISKLFCCNPAFFDELLGNRNGYKTCETEAAFDNEKTRTLKFTAVDSASPTEPRVVIVHDVTEEKAREADLEKQHKLEAVQALTGALMHNINQYLTVIMVRTQLMDTALQEHEVKREDIHNGLKDISSLSMRIAELLKSTEKKKDFVTESYVDNINILDITSPEDHGGISAVDMKVFRLLTCYMDVHEKTYSKHAGTTARCAARLAQELGLEKDQVTLCRRAGFLHDIGKIGISGSLLRKPHRLNKHEQVLVRNHVKKGCQLIKCFPFFEEEARVARDHHENFDGTGYPRGLKGKELSIITRIVSVSDAFEAMRANRPYDATQPFDHVYACIKERSGSQFCPEVVAAFESCAEDLNAFIRP